MVRIGFFSILAVVCLKTSWDAVITPAGRKNATQGEQRAQSPLFSPCSRWLAQTQKARAAAPNSELLRGFVLQIFQRQGDEVFSQIQFSIDQTDDGTHAALFVGDAVQHVELRGHGRLGHSGHFDLNGVKDPVLLNDQVDLSLHLDCLAGFVLLFLVFAVIVVHVEIVVQALVGIGLQNFVNDKGFKHGTGHRAVFQCFGRQPAGEIAAETSVAEIQFRCLDRPVQHAGLVGLEDIYDTALFQNGDPLLDGDLRHVQLRGDVGVIELLACPCGHRRHEADEG